MKLETLEYLVDWFVGLDDEPTQDQINQVEYWATFCADNDDIEE